MHVLWSREGKRSETMRHARPNWGVLCEGVLRHAAHPHYALRSYRGSIAKNGKFVPWGESVCGIRIIH